MMHRLGKSHAGAPNVPREVKRLRVSVIEQCMKLGQPILWRHMFTEEDEINGYKLDLHGTTPQTIAVRKCPACFDSSYGQVRKDCPVCFGVGFTSVEVNEDLWIGEDGQSIETTDTGEDNVPRYGGFGPAVLTWMVEPDTAVDIFKLDRQGALVKTQSAQGLAPWYPEMSDNDLVVNVDLSPQGYDIERELERFQLKMVQPQTIRGWGVKSRGQEHKAGQSFEMARIPRHHPLTEVQEHE